MKTATRAGLLPWAICMLGAVYFGYGYFLRIAPSVMIEELMRDFHVTATALGNLLAVYFYIYAALQIPVGLAADTVGPRRILIGAALVTSAGAALFAGADGLATAYAARLLIGAGAAVAWISTLKLALVWLPPERYSMVAGLANLVAMTCAIGAQAPLAFAVEAFGWRAATYGSAVAGLVIAACFWASRLAKPPARHKAAASGLGVLHTLCRVLAQPRPWIIAGYAGLAAGPMLAFAVLWGVPYAEAAYGVDRPTAGSLASTALIGWGLGGPLLGWISERLRRRLPVLAAAPLGGLAAWPVLLAVPDLPLAAVYLLLLFIGLCTGAVIVGFTVAKELAPTAVSGTATSLVNASAMIVTALYQVLIGWLLDLNWTGGLANGARLYEPQAYVTAFAAIPITLLVALVLLAFIPETRCRQVAADEFVA